MPHGVAPRPITTADYHAMIEAGILGPDDRVELLGGVIYDAPPIHSPHAGCVIRLTRWFSERVGERALVNVQNPVEISDLSEPEPDLSLLVPRATFYADRNPRPEDVLLVVEVAHATYRRDRRLKLPLYAEAGIRETWIVAVERQVVEVHLQPAGRRYRRSLLLRAGESVTPEALPDLELDVGWLFGRTG